MGWYSGPELARMATMGPGQGVNKRNEGLGLRFQAEPLGRW